MLDRVASLLEYEAETDQRIRSATFYPTLIVSELGLAFLVLIKFVLPRFASRAYKDPRAPQNLMPVAGLEKRLRGLLGDPKLLHRTLVKAAVR